MHQTGEIVEAERQNVFSYPRREEVIATLSLEQACADFSSAVSKAFKRFGKGESESHRTLKEYVAKNPESIGLGASSQIGTTEDPLPSGDSLDVSSMEGGCGCRSKSIAVLLEADVGRGLFQCGKYVAVMKAKIIAEERAQSTRVLLVIEAPFPQSLIPLKNLRGIEVVEGITPRKVNRPADRNLKKPERREPARSSRALRLSLLADSPPPARRA